MRGREFAMIFQNPRTALNPIRTVGRQIADVLERHADLTPAQAKQRTIEVLRAVKIADPERRAQAYPFELSGGMCQRIMIATALSCKPALLIADEPTTGLDVTIQAVIMKLIAEIAAAERMATLLITHDLALAAEQAGNIAVMHAGHIVEVAPTRELLAAPRHPYSRSLIAATPLSTSSLQALASIPGSLPDLRRDDLPACRFSERCERYSSDCDGPLPLHRISPRHSVACWHPL
jgi:peptide/nickel transport system ATP-binding protein